MALAACIGEFCGTADAADAADMLRSTALAAPLPPAPPLATVHAVVLPVLCRAQSARLPQLGLLADAVAAAARMAQHREFNVKVAAVRACERLVAWAAPEVRQGEVLPGLMPVLQAALAPDQDKALHAVRPFARIRQHSNGQCHARLLFPALPSSRQHVRATMARGICA